VTGERGGYPGDRISWGGHIEAPRKKKKKKTIVRGKSAEWWGGKGAGFKLGRGGAFEELFFGVFERGLI